MKSLVLVCLSIILISTSALAQSNPVPLISQPLVPASVKPGSGTLTLIVNGTGFSSSSTVNWNGSTRVTEFVSSSSLKALIKSSDVANPGTASVTVTNPGPGGGTSNVVFLPIRQTAPSVVFFPVPGFFVSPVNAVGDFNNDGKLDVAVAVANRDGSGTISVYLGNGDGTFKQPITTNSVTKVTSILVADFNGDGKTDFAMLDGEGNTTVFLGEGDGAFFQMQVFNSPSQGLVAGDFNGDGKLDLVAAGFQFAEIFLGKGDGTFGPPQKILSGTSFFGTPAVGDFDGDGNLDLAIPDRANVHVLLGNGDGTFQNDVSYPTANGGFSAAAADINGDGKLDIVTDGLSVLLGNGDGTFTSGGGVFLNTNSPAAVNLGDFNGDGKLDAAVVSNGANTIGLLIGNGDGTFQNPIDQLPANGTVSLSMGDFTGNGALDLVGGSIFLQIPVSLSPNSLNFGNQQVGTKSPPQAVTLENVGGAALKINQISIGGTNSNDFIQTNNCPGSLPIGASCTIKVAFAPKQQAQDFASLNVAYQGIGSPQSVALTGTGTAAPTVSLKPPSLTFATQTIGTTSLPQTATLTNTGSVAVTISTIAASGAFSETNNCPSSLPVGADCQIKVEFTPTAKGPASGKLSVTDDAKGSPQTVALSGTGTVVELSASSINFGDQKVGTKSAAVPVQLTNVGKTSLSISQIRITGADAGDFAETNNCGTSVPAGGSCTIKITFKPTAKGQRSANLSISDDGGGSPQIVALEGTGT
jgi:FG-GAP-like repeat/Abnormal spindle-like microcephaly-assoc'd, ASPM-SPD-2-Hydin